MKAKRLDTCRRRILAGHKWQGSESQLELETNETGLTISQLVSVGDDENCYGQKFEHAQVMQKA